MLGYEPDQVWTDEARWEFYNVFMRFTTAYERLNNENLPLTAGDVLLLYLEVHPYNELRNQTKEEIQSRLKKLWPDVRLLSRGEPVSLIIEHKDKGKSIRNLILGAPKIHAAFFYDMEPEDSSSALSSPIPGQRSC